MRRYKILFGGGVVFIIYMIIALLIVYNTSAQTSTWTVQTLKEYVDTRFDAIKDAIAKADAYSTYRDIKQNEFRSALDDQNKTFARKTELETLEKQLVELKDRVNKIETLKVGGSNTLYILIAIVSFFFAIYAFVRNYIMSNPK